MSFYLAMGFITIPAMAAVNVVKERQLRARHLQSIMGVYTSAYWAANLGWDMLLYAVPTLGGTFVLLVLGGDTFVGAGGISAEALAGMVLVFLGFGLSVLPLAYLCSLAFKKHTSAQTGMMVVGMLGLAITYFVSFTLQFPTLGVPDAVQQAVVYVSLLYPPFMLAHGLSAMSAALNCHYSPVSCSPPSLFAWGVLGRVLAISLACAALSFALLLATDRPRRRRRPAAGARTGPAHQRDVESGLLAAHAPAEEDEDVRRERVAVDDLAGPGGAAVLLHHLRKVSCSAARPRLRSQRARCRFTLAEWWRCRTCVCACGAVSASAC